VKKWLFSKNNGCFSWLYRENFVPLHQDAKQTKASKKCGITMQKNFLSRRDIFS